MSDEIEDDYKTGDAIADFINSPEGRAIIRKGIEDDTWGKGRPMIYMNKERQIVEHWKDGTINVIEQLPPLPPNNIKSHSFKIR
jgi:hypothetical protein